MAMTGSEIAKGGFSNEEEVANKFNNWKTDLDAQRWLKIMMYDLEEILDVKAEKIGQRGFKSDINVAISIFITKKLKQSEITTVENIQVKLVSGKSGFNQVEKRKVSQYIKQWHLTPNLIRLLKHYDGEIPPYKPGRHEKRMFVDEFSQEEQLELMNYFQSHIVMIVSDVIRGRGRFAAEWTLVINKYQGNYNWVLISINEAIQFYLGDCKVNFTKTGNIHLGNITLQRKGGDGGADSANMLQFKSDPMILFNKETLPYSNLSEENRENEMVCFEQKGKIS